MNAPIYNLPTGPATPPIFRGVTDKNRDGIVDINDVDPSVIGTTQAGAAPGSDPSKQFLTALAQLIAYYTADLNSADPAKRARAERGLAAIGQFAAEHGISLSSLLGLAGSDPKAIKLLTTAFNKKAAELGKDVVDGYQNGTYNLNQDLLMYDTDPAAKLRVDRTRIYLASLSPAERNQLALGLGRTLGSSAASGQESVAAQNAGALWMLALQTFGYGSDPAAPGAKNAAGESFYLSFLGGIQMGMHEADPTKYPPILDASGNLIQDTSSPEFLDAVRRSTPTILRNLNELMLDFTKTYGEPGAGSQMPAPLQAFVFARGVVDHVYGVSSDEQFSILIDPESSFTLAPPKTIKYNPDLFTVFNTIFKIDADLDRATAEKVYYDSILSSGIDPDTGQALSSERRTHFEKLRDGAQLKVAGLEKQRADVFSRLTDAYSKVFQLYSGAAQQL